MKIKLTLFVFIVLVFNAALVNANGFSSVMDGDWADGATWGNNSPGVVNVDFPGAGDDASISDNTVTVSVPMACNSITVSGGGGSYGQLILNADATVATDIYYQNDGTEVLFPPFIPCAFYNSGTLVMGGKLNIYAFSSTNDGSITCGSLDVSSVGCCGVGNASLTNNNQIITSSITGNSSGSYINGGGGTLYFNGPSISISSFNASAGGNTVDYNGTAQTIKATLYYNLTIDGGDTKLLENNLTVSNTLTFTDGMLNMNARTLTLGTSAAAPGSLSHSGTAASGWMYGGNFTRFFSAATIPDGDVAGLFPVGTSDGNFRPFYISCPVSAPASGGGITMHYTEANSATVVSFPDGASVVVKRHDAHWDVTTGGGFAGGTYNLNGQGTGFGTIVSVNDLRLTLVGSVVGTAGVNGGTVADPQVQRTGLTLANLTHSFYIASVVPGSSLPIELISFSAKLNESKTIDLDWTTASETNSNYFSIDRTKDGVHFETILTSIPAAGNSSTQLDYHAIDQHPLDGVSYYRLKETDLDGNYACSQLVAINLQGIEIISVYPNPASGAFRYTIGSSEDTEVSVNVIDMAGRKVISQHLPITKGANNLSIDVKSYSKGIYLLQVNTSNGLYWTQKQFMVN